MIPAPTSVVRKSRIDDIDTDLCTLTRHVLHEQSKHADAHGDLTLLLVSIQLGCKFVSSLVRKAGLANLYIYLQASSCMSSRTGLAGESNVQGEQQKKLDVLANEIFVNSLVSCGKVAMLVSEELEEPIIVDHRNKYIVVFDPLDGSSNIDSGVSIGTIFGVYTNEASSNDEMVRRLGAKRGRDMVAAGYAMYGSFTFMVLSTGDGVVNGYTLDPTLGEFILTNPMMKVPEEGTIYSVNEGNGALWDAQVNKHFDFVKGVIDHTVPEQFSALKRPQSLRYVGSMVADIQRTMLSGGLFAYPHDKRSSSGKLRLLYECFPMAFVVEHAGGRAIDGKGSNILDLTPLKVLEGQRSLLIHVRSPIILGSAKNVALYEYFMSSN